MRRWPARAADRDCSPPYGLWRLALGESAIRPAPTISQAALHGLPTTAVVTLWQSKAHKDRFEAEQLLPAFQVMGMTDVAVHSDFTAWETGELFIH